MSETQTVAEPEAHAGVAPADLPPESPWALMRRRFLRHRVAVGSLFMLTVLYAMALFAEFVAPYPQQWQRIERAFCPPQLPRFSWTEGLHFLDVEQMVDPVTFQRAYVERRDRPVPLGWFVRGESYRLWGLVSWDRHLIGPDGDDWRRSGGTGAVPTFALLGADKYGRDLFSRIVYGSRISLSVGMVAIVITFVLGVVIGGVSGYFGGAIDSFIQRVIEIKTALPNLPLWLALGAAVPADWSPIATYFGITIVLSLLGWTGLARVVRGKVLSLREEDYVVAARLLGAGHGRVLFQHLVPGFTSHIIVVLTLSVPTKILGETSLSFLGLGLRPPIVSWGVLLQDCLSFQTVSAYPWILSPVAFIALTVLCFNFLGDGLRDAADPYS